MASASSARRGPISPRTAGLRGGCNCCGSARWGPLNHEGTKTQRSRRKRSPLLLLAFLRDLCVFVPSWFRTRTSARCRRGGVTSRMSNKPKVYVTRIIPEEGMRLVREGADYSVWEEDCPVPREVLLREAAR